MPAGCNTTPTLVLPLCLLADTWGDGGGEGGGGSHRQVMVVVVVVVAPYTSVHTSPASAMPLASPRGVVAVLSRVELLFFRTRPSGMEGTTL